MPAAGRLAISARVASVSERRVAGGTAPSITTTGMSRSAVAARAEKARAWADSSIQGRSTSAGTTISGVLTLQGADRAAVTASLERVLETVARTYRDQADVRTAFVRVEAHPADDSATRVLTTEVVAPSDGANTTTDDLDAHFDV